MNEKDDVLVKARPLLEIVNTSWDDFLFWDIKESEIELFRKHERNGRPLGNTTFVKQLETILDRRLRPKKPGRRKIGKASPDYGGGLEQSWNGYLLDSMETVLKRAGNFVWRGVKTTVSLLTSVYQKGITLCTKEWDITIRPLTVN